MFTQQRISTITVSFRKVSPKELETFESWIQNVLWNNDIDGHSTEIHRAKGRLVTSDDDTIYILQGVCQVYELVKIDSSTNNKEEEEQEPLPDLPSKLVLIGKNLEHEILKNSLIKLFDLKSDEVE